MDYGHDRRALRIRHRPRIFVAASKVVYVSRLWFCVYYCGDQTASGGSRLRMELPDPSNPLQRWIADTAAGFRQLQATAGPGDGDVNFAQIVALSKKVAEGYVFLYEEGHICNVLRDDSNNRCRHIEERTKEHPEESIGTLSDLAKHELARIGTEGVRRGSNTNDALWILRIFRFVLKLFTYLQEPGFSVGTAARYVSTPVFRETPPPHRHLTTQICRHLAKC